MILVVGATRLKSKVQHIHLYINDLDPGGAGLKVKAQHIKAIYVNLTLGGAEVYVKVSNVVKCHKIAARYAADSRVISVKIKDDRLNKQATLCFN